MVRRLVNDNSDVTDQSLFKYTTQELNIKHALVTPDLRVFKDVERIRPVSGSSSDVLDGVGNVRPEFVNSNVEVIGDEKLSSVCHLTGEEGSVGQNLVLGVDLGVDV